MYCIPRKRKSHGCASSFYMLKNSKHGFKSFDSYELAQIAHYNQSYLAEYDLAPRVYSEVGRVRVGNTKSLSDWGYITEVARTIGCGGNDCKCGECDRYDLEGEYDYEISHLVDKLSDYDVYFGDCHIGNVGYVIRNGVDVMVCIDTGDESMSNDSGPCYCLECKKGYNCRG
jgi:hypothetical protein